MDEMTCTSATRGELYKAISWARYAGRRTILTVRGEPAAVLIPLADLRLLEQQPSPVQPKEER